MIARLQILTQDSPEFSHVEQAIKACKGGAEWLQLRVKDKPYEEWKDIAKEVVKIARANNVTVIINDSVQIALETDADGVHLGKDDMPIHSARMLLGKNKIVGGTANTLEDILLIAHAGADYVGLGPFKFTHTKKNISDILGIQGYRTLLKEVKDRSIDIPIIAIGGILPKDVRPLMATGVYGIAVASAVQTSPYPEKAIHEFRNAIKDSHHYASADHRQSNI